MNHKERARLFIQDTDGDNTLASFVEDLAEQFAEVERAASIEAYEEAARIADCYVIAGEVAEHIRARASEVKP